MGRHRKYLTLEEKILAKNQQDRERRRSLVAIKKQIERWNHIKDENQLQSDEDVARFLLDMLVFHTFLFIVN